MSSINPTSLIGNSKTSNKILNSKNNFLKSNTIIGIVCLIILVLVSVIGYKFSKSFMTNSTSNNKNVDKNNENINNSQKMTKQSSENDSTSNAEFRIVTPQCLYAGLNDDNEQILVVNVLSEKMPFLIGAHKENRSKSISKEQFEVLLSENNGSVPSHISLVFLMCAGWSCGAAKSYFEELEKRKVNVDKIVDYAGGLHEWCLYNKLNNNVFKLYNLQSSENNETNEASIEQISTLLKDTSHGYKTNTLIEKKEEPISTLCEKGNNLTNLL